MGVGAGQEREREGSRECRESAAEQQARVWASDMRCAFNSAGRCKTAARLAPLIAEAGQFGRNACHGTAGGHLLTWSQCQGVWPPPGLLNSAWSW